MKILNLQTEREDGVIRETVDVLRRGGVVVYPTETTYGIGVDATNQRAVNTLLKYKKRREGKPLSVAVADTEMARPYAQLNSNAERMYNTFLPGPVTVVSKGKHVVAKGVESELGTLGIRIPKYPLVLKIISTFGKPVTATGANASYKKRPYTIRDILDNTSKRQQSFIDLILDAGELPHNEPSTVIDTTLDEVAVLRSGPVAFSGKTEVKTQSEKETQELGKRILQKYRSALSHNTIIFCLEGELGAGKTQFSKGIALGLGVTRNIVSPTFTLSRNYPFEAEGKTLEFVHIDTWRMYDPGELEQLGFHEMVDRNSVIAIEWADRVTDFLRVYADEAKIIWVKFSYGKAENERIISYSDAPFSP